MKKKNREANNSNHRMKTIIGTDLELARQLLEAGELVAIPTETVYGLAANALNPDAVVKVFAAKDRPSFNPLIVHVASWQDVPQYVLDIPDDFHRLAERFTPGAITFLLPKNNRIPDLVTAGSPKVAVRIPAHPLAQALLRKLPFLLAAPSANPFGYASPTTARHVLDGLGGRIPYILDGGPCQVGLESTIVDIAEGEFIIRRKGGVAVEDIAAVLGGPVFVRVGADEHPVAPGQLKRHYATRTPLFVGDLQELAGRSAGREICVIAFGNNAEGLQPKCLLQLSGQGSLAEAARNLFAVLRQADHCEASVILAGWVPEEGLGTAINDRLRRAAHDPLPLP